RDRGGLAVVESLELTELGGALGEQVADPPDEAFTLVRLHRGPRPLVERTARRADGAVDVGGLAVRDVGEALAGGGIVRDERASGRGIDELAIDVQQFGAGEELTHSR